MPDCQGCRCTQIIISNHSGNYANLYPVCRYWDHCSVPWSRAFSEGDVQHYWSVTRWHIKSHTPFLWYQQSYPWVTWASVEENYMQRKTCPSPYHYEEQVSIGVQDQGAADYTPLWKSNRNLFSTQFFYNLFLLFVLVFIHNTCEVVNINYMDFFLFRLLVTVKWHFEKGY